MGSPTHLLAALAAACIALALLATPASAFLSYPESQTLSDHTGANPQVAIDEKGSRCWND